MLFKVLVLCCGFLLVTSQGRREGRFFSFNFEDKDISVDLDFSIPFITIPIKKTTEAFGLAEFPTININPASLVLGSAVVLGTTVILPFIMKHYVSTTNPNYRISRTYWQLQSSVHRFIGSALFMTVLLLGTGRLLITRRARPYSPPRWPSASWHTSHDSENVLDTTEFGTDGMINYASNILNNGSGLRGCTLKVACLTGQRRDEYLKRVVSRIASNQLMAAFINTTAVEDAMMSGRSGRDCTSYKPCPFQEHNIPILLHNLSVLGKSYGL